MGCFGLGFTSVYHLTGEWHWEPQLGLNRGCGFYCRHQTTGAGENWGALGVCKMEGRVQSEET